MKIKIIENLYILTENFYDIYNKEKLWNKNEIERQ